MQESAYGKFQCESNATSFCRNNDVTMLHGAIQYECSFITKGCLSEQMEEAKA